MCGNGLAGRTSGDRGNGCVTVQPHASNGDLLIRGLSMPTWLRRLPGRRETRLLFHAQILCRF